MRLLLGLLIVVACACEKAGGVQAIASDAAATAVADAAAPEQALLTGPSKTLDLDGVHLDKRMFGSDRPTGRISIPSKLVDDSTLTPDIVLAKIQSAYMSGVKRCYKTHLTKDPAAHGKLVLRFTVDTTGRTTNASATGFAKDVSDCTTAQIKTWRFPIPKDKDGEPTETSFAITLEMVPS